MVWVTMARAPILRLLRNNRRQSGLMLGKLLLRVFLICVLLLVITVDTMVEVLILTSSLIVAV